MKMLAGSFDDYTGQILIRGKEVQLHSPSMAKRHGIGMIYQELSLARPISIAENLLVGRLPTRGGFLDRGMLLEESGRWLAQVGLSLDPMLPMEDISQQEAQLVEIAKVLSNAPHILVMDEPTSALSREEVERLFGIIETLKKSGLAIVYISLHLPEVFRVADRVTVMRDGKKVGTRQVREATREEIVQMMVGRTELARVLVGLDGKDSGRMVMEGRTVNPRSMAGAMRLGIAYLTEDRKTEGLALRLTMGENILSTLVAQHSRAGGLHAGPGKRRAWAAHH